ncbi:BCCT family transporter [Campylobacter geochelonis]|uniref:High-affinity choline transport protein n=1 Tax=Campylobacter geochelonis TaxID=1780362 RepID=A0A128EBV9_9BACT|nr:BCCT family transporter [Campylobacter geochelonis]QKF72222.1 BCCT (betaine/carnitine/choline) family transporter [Campylobacter geochelonis]CZE46143.1 high-affinity choline transport protein [Campylobacter geochelonis]CZE46484.1 high-affinity choline transport protein [Campylobacter geochelonis]CZE50778.1 high-affinity choline transport protein [Campylobacter geochelonis]
MNKSKPSWVFYTSVTAILSLMAFSLFFQEFSTSFFKTGQSIITNNFGWFYVLSVTIIVISVIYLGFSRLGEIKLGLDHSQPEYKNFSWFAMLFSAGMGIGLMFFGVAEPLMHYLNPPTGDAKTIQAAKQAMNITFFHWGLSAWAIYAIIAIILAFFSFRHNLPLTLRSAFYPLIGDRIYGKFGDMIDVFAVVATLFGVATSLGYGVIQANAGFNYIFGVSISTTTQMILIAIFTLLATASAVSGIGRGIKILSNINMIMAVALLIFILLTGNTIYLVQSLVQNTGNYISTFITNTFNLYAYDKQNEVWLGGWTLFYWAWWLAWSPFVGLFIAKISKGRTIREFIIGVLLVPTGFTFMWMTFFGNSAIKIVQTYPKLAQMVNSDVSLSLYMFLEKFPASGIISVLATVMIIIFFVTSADSASTVLNMLCSNGNDKTALWQKIFWGLSIGVVAMVLMLNDGLAGLQAMTIIFAFPFTIALMVAIYGLFKALKIDFAKKNTQIFNPAPISQNSKSWQERLRDIIYLPEQTTAQSFVKTVVAPVFFEIKTEFKKNGLNSKIITDKANHKIHIVVALKDESDFLYGIKLVEREKPSYASKDDSYYRAEVFLKEGGQNYDVFGWAKQTLINDIVEQYRKHMQFLHIVR